MKYSLLVLDSPWRSQAADSAYQFAEALMRRGHELYRVFFYREGVHNGSAFAVTPQTEQDRVAHWAALSASSGAELVVCIASATRRGLLDEAEAIRHQRAAANIHPAFTVSGLGQLVDASVHSDRVLTFGG